MSLTHDEVEEPAALPAVDLVSAFVRHRDELVGFLFRRLGCRATAEDLTHDVFLRARRSPGEVRHVRGLLFTTARNLAANHRRDETRRADLRTLEADLLSESAETRTPERALIATDALRRLVLSMDRWPARTRQVFILNRYEGLTQVEIAARLRISTTAVEKAMARAILRLAQLDAADAEPRVGRPTPSRVFRS